MNYCNHSNCLNGGKCVELENGFTCKCSEGNLLVLNRYFTFLLGIYTKSFTL